MDEVSVKNQPSLGASTSHALLLAARDRASKGAGTVTPYDLITAILRYRAPGEPPQVRRTLSGLRSADGWPPADRVSASGGRSDVRPAVDETLRETSWRVRSTRPATQTLTWDDSIRFGLDRALDEAESADVQYSNLVHLAVGLLQRPLNGLDGVEYDQHKLISELRSDPARNSEDLPHLPTVSALDMTGELDSEEPRIIQWLARRTRRGLVRRSPYGGLVALCLMEEALRQCVRHGHRLASSAHLLLGILSFDLQITQGGRRLPAVKERLNRAGHLLATNGLTPARAAQEIDSIPLAQDDVDVTRAKHIHPIIEPRWTREAADVIDMSIGVAREHSHAEVGSSHLLAAAVDITGSDAAALVAACGVSPDTLRSQIRRDLESSLRIQK